MSDTRRAALGAFDTVEIVWTFGCSCPANSGASLADEAEAFEAGLTLTDCRSIAGSAFVIARQALLSGGHVVEAIKTSQTFERITLIACVARIRTQHAFA